MKYSPKTRAYKCKILLGKFIKILVHKVAENTPNENRGKMKSASCLKNMISEIRYLLPSFKNNAIESSKTQTTII